MKINEANRHGNDHRIYSGNYLISKGYSCVVGKDPDFLLGIPKDDHHLNKRYIVPFPDKEQFSSTYKRYHHTSDIHAIVYEQLVNVGQLQAGMFYIPIGNTDYFPHNRTNIRRSKPTGIIVRTRGRAPERPITKMFAVIGQRPKSKFPKDYDITDESVYGAAKEFFTILFKKAIKKYGKDEVVLLTNGVVGYTQLAQSVAIDLGINVYLHLPFKTFSSVWRKREIERFNQLARKSYLTDLGYGVVPDKEHINKCLMRSGLLLVEKCNHLITVYDGKSNNEVRSALIHAKKKGVHVVNLLKQCPSKDDLYQYVQDYYKI
jgi:hypothetical protein